MEEIKVGEYVRTKTQGICKLIANEKEPNGKYVGYVDKPFFLREDNILKHNPNIMELLECGDYVNGHLIYSFIFDDEANKKGITKVKKVILEETMEEIDEKNIKFIATKEQLEIIKYEVK